MSTTRSQSLGMKNMPIEKWNYNTILTSGVLINAAHQFASTRLVFPWILSMMGISHFVSALLVPLGQIGQFAGNQFFPGLLFRFEKKRLVYALCMMGRALAILGVVLAMMYIEQKFVIGTMVVVCVVLMGGIVSISKMASRTVTAHLVSGSRRGRLMSSKEVFGSLLTLGVLLLHGKYFGAGTGTGHLSRLFFACGLLLLGALSYAFVIEGKDSKKEAKPKKDARTFSGESLRNMSGKVRRYLLIVTFSQPTLLLIAFLTMHASTVVSHLHALSAFVMSSVVGTGVSGFVCRHIVDRKVSAVILGGPLLGLLTTAMVLTLDEMEPMTEFGIYCLAFFLAAMSFQFTSIGLNTLLVGGFDRKDIARVTALSSSSGGLISLLLSVPLGAIAHLSSPYFSMGGLTLLQVVGFLLVWRLLRREKHFKKE